MTKEEIESLPQLNELVQFLSNYKLDQIVYDILGGSPLDYIQLNDAFRYDKTFKTDKIIESMKMYIKKNVLSKSLNQIISKSSINTKNIINLFRTEGKTRFDLTELKSKGFVLDSLNKVFREIEINERTEKTTYVSTKIEPSTPVIGLIITKKLVNDELIAVHVDELFKLVGQ